MMTSTPSATISCTSSPETVAFGEWAAARAMISV